MKTKQTVKIPEEEKESLIPEIKNSPKKVGFKTDGQVFTPPPKNINNPAMIKGIP